MLPAINLMLSRMEGDAIIYYNNSLSESHDFTTVHPLHPLHLGVPLTRPGSSLAYF